MVPLFRVYDNSHQAFLGRENFDAAAYKNRGGKQKTNLKAISD